MGVVPGRARRGPFSLERIYASPPRRIYHTKRAAGGRSAGMATRPPALPKHYHGTSAGEKEKREKKDSVAGLSSRRETMCAFGTDQRSTHAP